MALVDGAGEAGVAHAGHPGQADHAVPGGHHVVQVQSGQHQRVVPVVGVGRVPGQQAAGVL